MLGVAEDDERGVGVDVDEAGGDDASLGVDDFPCFLLQLGDVAAVDGNGIAGDSDGGVEAGVGGAVDNHSAFD